MPTALGALGAGNVTNTQAAGFIPQVWDKDTIVAFKRKLGAKDFFLKKQFTGKGNVLNMPGVVRGSAQVKTPGTAVQVQFATEPTIPLNLNRHFQYARMIEDITAVQALDSLRSEYTDDAGYQLALNQDKDIFALGSFLNNGGGAATYATAFVAGDGNTLYTSGAPNATAITDAGIRKIIERLLLNDVDTLECGMFLSPVAYMSLAGINRFTEQAFVGEQGNGNVIRTGRMGNIYGLGVMATNNLPTATGGARANIIAHKGTFVCAEQMAIRSQSQYKLEFLASLYVSDILYGVACRRPGTADIPTSGFAVMTPA
jgi:hypothetical protein